MLSRGWLSREHRIFLPLAFLVLYLFIQTLPLLPSGAISADPYETRLSVLKLLALVLAGVLLLRYAKSEQRLRALLYTLIAVGVLSAFFGILRQTTQHSQGFFLPFLSPGNGYGQFINRNHFAYLMEMTLGLLLGLIVFKGVRREQVLVYLALALPVWAALVLCNSRGGLFSMLTQVLFLALLFILFQTRRTKRGREESEEHNLLWRISQMRVFRALLIVVLLVAVFIGALWIGGEALTSRLEAVSTEVAAESDAGNHGVRRQEIWRATIKMIEDHPFVGVGFNGYLAAIPQYHNASGAYTPQQAHNDYLEILASGGIIGVLLIACFLFLLFKGIRQSFRAQNPFRRAASLGACAGLFGVAVHSLVDFGLHITINALVFTALVVVALAGGQGEEQKVVGNGERRRTVGALTTRKD